MRNRKSNVAHATWLLGNTSARRVHVTDRRKKWRLPQQATRLHTLNGAKASRSSSKHPHCRPCARSRRPEVLATQKTDEHLTAVRDLGRLFDGSSRAPRKATYICDHSS
eukprot:Amastigsp_a518184_17.p2 type:complete len:109 gc:universal Amastigsp_a518184_17:328-2(-)